MTRYAYKAIPTARRGAGMVSGRLEAADEGHLRDLLRDQGLVPVDVRPERITDALRSSLSRRRLSNGDAAWFFSTLRSLLESKIPLESAVATMEEMAPGRRLPRVCAAIRQSLRGGETLADAAGEHEGLLNPQRRALLETGLASGRLEHSIALIDRALQNRSRMVRTIVGRLVYPAILLVVAVGAVWFLATFVIPRFAETLESLGGELPLPTRITLEGGRVLAWLLPVLLAALAAVVALRERIVPARIRRRIAERALRTPVVGTLIWHHQAGMLTDIMATMIEGGADVLDALEQARDVVSSPVLADRLDATRRRVRDGADLGQALADEHVLPPMSTTIVKLGMRTGDLAGSLRRASEMCAEVQDRLTQRLLVFMEPAIVLFLAGTVGWVVYSLVTGMLAMNDLGSL